MSIFSLKTRLFSLKVMFFLCFIEFNAIQAQDVETDAFFIKDIYDQALTDQMSYRWLHYLSENIGGRIAGSPQSMAAIEFTHQILDTLNCDQVYNQPCKVNYWYRGAKEQVRIVNHPKLGSIDLKCLALGGSGASPTAGLVAEVIEFSSIEDAKKNPSLMKGKIVFFSRPFDQKFVKTFHAYGSAVDQRVQGPNIAAKAGAKACIVRSMSSRTDDVPHTGGTLFDKEVSPIPSIAISTKAADLLKTAIAEGTTSIYVKTSCENRGEKQSYSVIGEIKGSEKPEEIILIGGHLDSWDVGGGAHDDGAGCVQSMEVIYLLQKLNYKPKRTIRCVLFQNEENGLAGGKEYARVSNENKEFHLAAIESDAGGFSPRGFGFDADTSVISKYIGFFKSWSELLEPYDLRIWKGGGGADIGPLKSQKGMLFGLSPDSQRYFDYHHTEIDRIETVHPRELALGSAAMTSLVYLIDKYGLTTP
ncbi:MAG: M28 family peptidase [Saprospiraceae bacterium]